MAGYQRRMIRPYRMIPVQAGKIYGVYMFPVYDRDGIFHFHGI